MIIRNSDTARWASVSKSGPPRPMKEIAITDAPTAAEIRGDYLCDMPLTTRGEPDQIQREFLDIGHISDGARSHAAA